MRQVLSVNGRSVLFASLFTTALLIVAKALGVLEPLELFFFDRLTALPPEAPSQNNTYDSRLLIVGMTENDIQKYGWPLPNQRLADILQYIQQHRPKVIGLDLYRNALRYYHSSELNAQLAADNLIAIMNVGSDPNQGAILPPPSVPHNRIGFNDLAIDPDGIVRRSLLFVGDADREYYSFGLRLVLGYLAGASQFFRYDQDALYLGDTPLPALKRGSGGYQMIDERGYQVVLRYRSRHTPAQYVTVSQVLSGNVSPDLIRNRIVLVGTIAPSLKDQFYTPYSAGQATDFTMAGVVMHAQITSQLLDVVERKPALYRFLPQWGELLWLMSWTTGFGIITWQFRHPLLHLGIGFLSLIAVLGVTKGALVFLIWLPIAEPMVGIVFVGGLVTTQMLLYRSTHDQLTGLPNRELFCHHIQHALQASRRAQVSHPIIVVFLDLDRFKLINQSWGHGVGDQVLDIIVNRLQQHLPHTAQLARVGGDEFAILLQHLTQAEVEQLLDRIQLAIAQSFFLNNQRLSITTSAGLVIAQNNYNYQPEDLLRDAHTAMYWAKSLGQSRYQVFASEMLTEAVNQLLLTSDLSAALNNQEFLLYYQPIIDLRTKQVIGFEALVRWYQPQRGFVLPNMFIPIAEDTELILPLGQWIFHQACQQLKRWHQQFPHHPLKMSINLSRRQLFQANLIQQLTHSLQDVGISGQFVTLEITESIMMHDQQTTMTLMLQLRELGLQLSIDDFGTGYSSLSQLHSFPMDILKIDKSFVGRMEHSQKDRAIVQTIITLGRELGMEIVAEGIESSAQLVTLERNHCQYGQGYLFAPPLSADQATQWLAQRLITES